MVKVKCLATCWMPPSAKKGTPLELFEDDPLGDGSDVYEVADEVLEDFLATGRFQKVD